MPDPSEHSQHVSEFVDDRWNEIVAEFNGHANDEISPTQKRLTRGVLRAIGYANEDAKARLEQHEADHHSDEDASGRGRAAGIGAGATATVAGAIEGALHLLGFR